MQNVAHAEPAREIDVVHETEVLVVGSGPADSRLPSAAARAGARTTPSSVTAASASDVTAQVGVEGVAWYRHERRGNSTGGHRRSNLRGARRKAGAAIPEPQIDEPCARRRDVQVRRRRAGAGRAVDPMLHRTFVAPLTRRLLQATAGREAILARRVIDATGDADVAARAGARVHKTPREEVRLRDVLHVSIDKQRFTACKADAEPTRTWNGGGEWRVNDGGENTVPAQAVQAGRGRGRDPALAPRPSRHLGRGQQQGDLTYLNMIHLRADGTDPGDLTRSEIEEAPGGARDRGAAPVHARCERAKLRNFGMTLGRYATRARSTHGTT